MIMTTVFPFASLFALPDEKSEQVDEMLFGDTAEILEESELFVKVKTEYGYFGWTERKNLSDFCFTPNARVSSTFADILTEPKNFFKPEMTLPFGAKIYIEDIGDPRYFKILMPNEKELFIHKNHVSMIKTPKYENEIRTSVIDNAMQYLGAQYRWGGRTYSGIDCSGLCFNAYRFCGIDIWRDAHIEKSERLSKIDFKDAKPADLLFFKGHVALYLGNGTILHSTASKGKVCIEKLYENQYLNEIYICTGTIFK